MSSLQPSEPLVVPPTSADSTEISTNANVIPVQSATNYSKKAVEAVFSAAAKSVAAKFVSILLIALLSASFGAYSMYRLFLDKLVGDALHKLKVRVSVLDNNIAFTKGLVSKTIPFEIDKDGYKSVPIPLGDAPITGGEFLTCVVLYDPSGFSQTNKWIVQVAPKSANSTITGGDGIALQITTIIPSGKELATPVGNPYISIEKDADIVTESNGARPKLLLRLKNNRDAIIKGGVICTGHGSIATW